MNLVIVESPAKSKIIQRILKEIAPESRWEVEACMGHIADLPRKDAVDVKHSYAPKYEVIADKAKVLARLRKRVKACDKVFLATDADREGEAIAWHLKRLLKLARYSRMTFQEITPGALRASLGNLRQINEPLVMAQQARRVLDRLVGYETTAMLWKQFEYSRSLMSAGRVQSAALKMICDRESELSKFVPTCEYRVTSEFDGREVTSVQSWETLDSLKDYMQSPLSGRTFSVKDVSKTLSTLKAPFPHTTSTLQQDAFSHGMSISRCMKLAQDLYTAGRITYMRTDSTHLSPAFVSEAHGVIRDTYGGSMTAPYVSKKSKTSQEAHEAIRPTHPEDAGSDLVGAMHRLYTLIRNRSLAALMIPCVSHVVTVLYSESDAKVEYRNRVSSVHEPGWRVVYGDKVEASVYETVPKKGSRVGKVGDLCSKAVMSSGPSRYSEATIVSGMEGVGVGRPSTYASILNKLLTKAFVENKNVVQPEYQEHVLCLGKKALKDTVVTRKGVVEKNRLVVTPLGSLVNEFMGAHFPAFVDVEFSSMMETSLDSIVAKKSTYYHVVDIVYRKLFETVDSIGSKLVRRPLPTTEKREFCVSNQSCLVRSARYGPVIQCGEKYVPLAPFYRWSSLSQESIEAKHVNFLVSLPVPFTVGELHYGRYGFYVKPGGGGKQRKLNSSEHQLLKDQLLNSGSP